MASAVHHPAVETIPLTQELPATRSGTHPLRWLRGWLLSGAIALAFLAGFATGAFVGAEGERAAAELEVGALWR
jgi:hypothetical protein